MQKWLFVVFWMLVCAVTGAQEVEVIVPQSGPPLNHSFLFADPASGSLLLLYEKHVAGPGSLVLEVRRQKDLSPVKRSSLAMKPREVLRLAENRPPYGILVILQQNSDVTVLTMDPATGRYQRSSLYTLEEARKLDRTVQRIDPAGLTWDDRQQRAVLLLNLRSASGTKTLLAGFYPSGARAGAPVRIDAGKGESLDLVYNSCRGDFAAITTRVVRLLKDSKLQTLIQPEEIAFDPELCRYAVVRRPFNQIPQFYSMDASLSIQSIRQLPGEVAPQLIQETRNQVAYSAERHSFIYPTWAAHQRLYINEITPSGIRTSLLATPIDSASMSVAVQGDRVFLLLSGLQFGLFERLHRLVLISVPVP